jgi:hypothetical protein
MPNENERRSCNHKDEERNSCHGTQTFKRNVGAPGFHAGTTTKTGEIVWGSNERRNGWVCNKNAEHFDPE